jgi:hypothetical protein
VPRFHPIDSCPRFPSKLYWSISCFSLINGS